MPMGTDAELETLFARIWCAPSEFYRQRLIDAGLTAPDGIGPEALVRVPLTRREEIVRDQLGRLPYGTRRFTDARLPVRAGITGSGNTLLVLTWSAADLTRERAAGARLLGRLGVAAGMRVANTLPGALTTPGALLLGDVIEEIGALDVPLGVIENETAARQAWELMDRVRPTVLILEPAPASRLLAVVPAAARPWWRGVVWLQRGAERTPPPPVPDAAGFQGWQRTWLAVAEATCFVAHSCVAARFHADEGVIAEIVDHATGAASPANQFGTLALTPLGVDTPVLRYASGVRARAISSCACGTGGMVLELAG
jgi:phenylacetate-coenzyme A ligase PaaK-like adenylate-forming protein